MSARTKPASVSLARWWLAVDAATPASEASMLAGSDRPSASASRTFARAGSASRAPTVARSASPAGCGCALTPAIVVPGRFDPRRSDEHRSHRRSVLLVGDVIAPGRGVPFIVDLDHRD